MKSENTKYGISVITGLLVAALLIMLVVHCTSCTTERATQTRGMVGYTPYKPSFKIKHNACSQKNGY